MTATFAMFAPATFALGCLVIATFYLVKARTKSQKYPPGPRGWPLIGNLLDMPKGDEWVKYREWAQEYNSDIVHVEVFGTHIVLLNSLEAISDLLDKRSSIYSDRPATPMMNLMGWSWLLTIMPANAEWRGQRRHFRQEFDGGAIRRHYPAIIDTTHGLLKGFLETPEQWKEHLRHMVGATIIDITYGFKALPKDDPHIQTAEAAFSGVSQALLPGAFLVDQLPILKYVPAWVPGAGFQRKAQEWKKSTDKLYESAFLAMKEAMANGTARPCFCVRTLQDAEARGELESEERHIQAAAAGMYVSGSDTTLTILQTFMLAMVLHPEAQKAAQAELDTVIGPDRLPTFADEESLPYLAAVIKECWRWEVIGPTAVPHMLTVDDQYKGYFLPKGTIVIPNSFTILNDEKAYPEPSVFKPERFLKDGKLDPSVRNPTVAAFGYGRRVCPGRALAEQSAWLAAACILSLFDITKAIDHNGEIIEPSGRYIAGLTRAPEPFECQIQPRHSAGAALIKAIENTALEQ
ncbi:hypothetical protein HWV62_4259 [Athelia sp. TMB]|nr:hypothetical protein HWV62_4259 [Athelia sp. TMB]